MKVYELIKKLQKVKDQNAFVVLGDHKGEDQWYSKEIDIYQQKCRSDETQWEDEPPDFIPKGIFNIVIIDT